MVPSKSLIYQREQRDLANVLYESIYTQRESREGERETDLTKENVLLLHNVQGERERPSQHFFQNAHAFMQREREEKTWHKRLLLHLSTYLYMYIYIYTHTHTHNIKRGRKEGTYKDFSKTPIHLCREKAHLVFPFLRDGLGKKKKKRRKSKREETTQPTSPIYNTLATHQQPYI